LIEDCGNSFCSYGENYCSDNKVVRDVICYNLGCDNFNVACHSKLSLNTTETVETCSSGYECLNGECIKTELNITIELNDTEVMRGYSVSANGTAPGINCSDCLTVFWDSTMHILDIINGTWNDSYEVKASDPTLYVTAMVNYGNESGIASATLVVNSNYTVSVSCNSPLLNRYEEQVCDASVADIDGNPVTEGVNVTFTSDSENYTDTESPYEWRFNVSRAGNLSVTARAVDSHNNSGNASAGFRVKVLNVTIALEIEVFNNEHYLEESEIIFPRYDTGRFDSEISITVYVRDWDNGTLREANITLEIFKPDGTSLNVSSLQPASMNPPSIVGYAITADYSLPSIMGYVIGLLSGKTQTIEIEKGVINTYNSSLSHSFELDGYVPGDSGNYTVFVNATDREGVTGSAIAVIPVSFWRVKIDYDVTSYVAGQLLSFEVSTWFNYSPSNVTGLEVILRDNNRIPVSYMYYPGGIFELSEGRYGGNFTTSDIDPYGSPFYLDVRLSGELAEDTNADITLLQDTQPPQFSDEKTHPDSPAEYLEEGYQFNVTVIDDAYIDAVLLEFDGVNYTVTNYTGNWTHREYSYTLERPPGNYSYRWFANDTVNGAYTGTLVYEIAKASSETDLLLNGVDSNLTVEKGEVVNVTATSSGVIDMWVNLYSGSEMIANGTSPLYLMINTSSLSIGVYTISAIFNGSENYSWSFDSHQLTVVDTVGPSISATEINPIGYGNIQNVTATVTDTNGVDTVLIELSQENHTMNPGYCYSWTPPELPGETVHYKIYASDSLGNWNSYEASFLIQNLSAGPLIIDVQLTDPLGVGEEQSISTTVLDVEGVDTVLLEVGGEKHTMSLFDEVYLYSWIPAELAGTVYFRILANNTLGNWNYYSGAFVIADTEVPTLFNLEEIDPIEYGETQHIAIEAEDNDGISTVLIEFNQENHTMDSGYWYEWTPLELGVIDYRVYAIDNSGNTVSINDSFRVQDTVKPEIVYSIEPDTLILGETLIPCSSVKD